MAHPPPRTLNPSGIRGNHADLNGAEISTANMGRFGRGTQILVEHDAAGGQVGSVITSWEGPGGQLRVQGELTDPAAQQAVRSGAMRGLSLGTNLLKEADGKKVYMRTHDELSICERPARPGCIITDIDGRSVGSTHQFARKRGECSSR